MCAPSHHLSGKPEVQPYCLASEHLLLTERGCCYRNQFERTLIDAGVYNTNGVSDFISIEAIKECVKLNMGIAALSFSSVINEIKRGELKVIKLGGAAMTSAIHCAYDNKKTTLNSLIAS